MKPRFELGNIAVNLDTSQQTRKPTNYVQCIQVITDNSKIIVVFPSEYGCSLVNSGLSFFIVET